MQESIEAARAFFGAIGAENLGAFFVFASTVGYAVFRGLRHQRRVPATPTHEPIGKRLERMEAEYGHLEDRQALSDARLARLEGQVGVLQTLVLGGRSSGDPAD